MDKEPFRIMFDDLLVADQPGDIGIRRDSEGTWIPFGVNPMKHIKARVKSRKEWEDEERAGGRWSPAGLMIPVTQCSHCGIVIGRGYPENEAYLFPQNFKTARDEQGCKINTPAWNIVCAYCAINDLELPFGFCLICQDDYTGPVRDRLQAFCLTAAVLGTKMKHLNEAILPAWNAHVKGQKEVYRAKHGSLRGFPRLALFQQFLSTQRPEPLTFTQILSALTSREGENHDRAA